MPNTENRKNSNKKPTLQEHSQTVIIPQLTPEMLEQARRAAEQGKTAEQIEREALAAAQAEQKAVESKQEAPTAEKPKTVQPANKPKTRKEAEEELAQNIHDDHLWLNNPVMVRGLGLAPIVAVLWDVCKPFTVAHGVLWGGMLILAGAAIALLGGFLGLEHLDMRGMLILIVFLLLVVQTLHNMERGLTAVGDAATLVWKRLPRKSKAEENY